MVKEYFSWLLYLSSLSTGFFIFFLLVVFAYDPGLLDLILDWIGVGVGTFLVTTLAASVLIAGAMTVIMVSVGHDPRNYR